MRTYGRKRKRKHKKFINVKDSPFFLEVDFLDEEEKQEFDFKNDKENKSVERVKKKRKISDSVKSEEFSFKNDKVKDDFTDDNQFNMVTFDNESDEIENKFEQLKCVLGGDYVPRKLVGTGIEKLKSDFNLYLHSDGSEESSYCNETKTKIILIKGKKSSGKSRFVLNGLFREEYCIFIDEDIPFASRVVTLRRIKCKIYNDIFMYLQSRFGVFVFFSSCVKKVLDESNKNKKLKRKKIENCSDYEKFFTLFSEQFLKIKELLKEKIFIVLENIDYLLSRKYYKIIQVLSSIECFKIICIMSDSCVLDPILYDFFQFQEINMPEFKINDYKKILKDRVSFVNCSNIINDSALDFISKTCFYRKFNIDKLLQITKKIILSNRENIIEKKKTLNEMDVIMYFRNLPSLKRKLKNLDHHQKLILLTLPRMKNRNDQNYFLSNVYKYLGEITKETIISKILEYEIFLSNCLELLCFGFFNLEVKNSQQYISEIFINNKDINKELRNFKDKISKLVSDDE